MAIEIAGLNNFYGAFHVLHDIDLKVRQGERIVLCGPSGSGKSTLTRCINRLEIAEKGQILVDRTDLSQNTREAAQVRSQVGMVFQHFNLFPHMSVLDNCTLAPMTVRGLSRKKAEELARWFWPRSASKARPTNTRASCPVGNNSAWRLPGRCAWSRRSCCSMNPPRRWTRRWSVKCWM